MNRIIAELYQCREIAALVSKLPDFPDPMDVKQEAFMVLMAKNEAVIAGLHERGELKAFACKVISNTAKWTNGQLRTQMGKEITMDVLPDVADTQEEQPAVPMDSVHWYNAELLRLYAEHGTYRKVAEVTGIPFKSTYNAIKKAARQIKKAI